MFNHLTGVKGNEVRAKETPYRNHEKRLSAK